jgi:hypothetical protein
VELTRARRAVHLGVLTAFLFVGAGCCMFPAGWLAEIAVSAEGPMMIVLEEKDLRSLDDGLCALAASCVGAGPASGPPLVQLQADLILRQLLAEKIEADRRRADAQLDVLNPITRQQVLLVRQSVQERQSRKEDDPRYQERARHRLQMYRVYALAALTDSSRPDQEAFFMEVMYAAVLAWPVLWVAWAFLWRGGLSYRLMNIDLVRADGRPALRVQCAWRALLVWAPVTGLLVLSLWLQDRFWTDWYEGDVRLWRHSLVTALWYAALALLAVYAALALARPARAPHDRLAGTYLVPR